MKSIFSITVFLVAICCISFSLHPKNEYRALYESYVGKFRESQASLLALIRAADCSKAGDLQRIRREIDRNRLQLKTLDFWFRYLEPISYRKINGPLPVEWENEVFEKFEPPYKRTGAGLTLAALYLDVPVVEKDSLSALIDSSLVALNTFEADSITGQLQTPDHFFLANRLFLLNLAAIYTTGFECPDTNNIIPELKSMLRETRNIYDAFNLAFPNTPLSADYLARYDSTLLFAERQNSGYSSFDHFVFTRDYVNKLYGINQRMISRYGIISGNFNDYSLNNDCYSIFDKSLYHSQNSKGVFSLVEDPNVLNDIRHIGKLLFYDPLLSGNNARSCASCHKPTGYFTDTTQSTAFQFDHRLRLPRNTPSLVNVIYNHLIMLDGKHYSLQMQAKEVIRNPIEMNGEKEELLQKLMSCRDYKTAFRRLLKYTPEEKEVSLDHIVSAITYYYSSFSQYNSPFDDAMNLKSGIDKGAMAGFNLFMGKAKCGTCHFVPIFNGVKPPYIGSEFEVLGVPEDSGYKRLSGDQGRYLVNPAAETLHAFRTNTVRNVAFTKPYMHNGVFQSLQQVIDFYDAGGGKGKMLPVANQTLSSDSLHLTAREKNELILFLSSLNENIIFETPPASLPNSSLKELNNRKVGGEY